MYKILAIFMAIFLGGCAAGRVDENFAAILLENNQSAEISVDERWWQGYNEPYLNELVELALKNNTDLAKAAINLRKSLAQVGVLDADLMPSFNATSDYKRSRDISTSAEWNKGFSSGISLNYELDLFGKLRDARDASEWESSATRYDLDAARLSVINAVVDGYFNALYLRESTVLYADALANYEKILYITKVKFQSGKDEELSLKQVQTQILNMQNRLKSTQKNIDLTEQTLKNLLNERPNFAFKFKDTLDILPIGVSLDVPFWALTNRPDLNAAIARINKNLLNMHASKKAFYPSITIGASLSGNDDKFLDSFSLKILGGNIALNLPFLNYSRLKNNLRVSEENFNLSKVSYIQLLTTALNELDTAYKALKIDTELYENFTKQIKNYEEISKIYALKNEAGKVELKEFLQAKNSEIEARINLVSQRYKMLSDEIKIFQAMAARVQK